MKERVTLVLMFLLASCLISCSEDDNDTLEDNRETDDNAADSSSDGVTDNDPDRVGDSDPDSDADSDVDADSDADSDAERDTEPVVPVDEIWVRVIINCVLNPCTDPKRLNIAAWKKPAGSGSGRPPDYTLLEQDFSDYPLDKIFKSGHDLLSKPKKWNAGQLTFEAFHDMSYSPLEWSAVKGDPRQEDKQTVMLERGKLATVRMTLHIP